jgi:hypothetical protein
VSAVWSLAEDFIGGEGSRLFIIIATVGGTAALVSTIGVLLGRREATVERRLAGYELGEEVESSSGLTGEPDSAFVQGGVDLASRLAGRTSLLSKTERMLEQADVAIRPGELLFYVPMFAVFAFLFLRCCSIRLPACSGRRRWSRCRSSSSGPDGRGDSSSSNACCRRRSGCSPAPCGPVSR